jgi:hypothetical protein
MNLLKATTGFIVLNLLLTAAIIATGHLVSYLIGSV